MDPDSFAHLLALGLGRPLRYLEDHDPAPYRAVILDTCLHNTAYLPQYLWERGTYVFDLIDRAGDRPFYRDRILSALPTGTDSADVDQLCDLARLFAMAVDAEARVALYAKFRSNNTEQAWMGAEAIIALDGLDGVLAVAERIGVAVLAEGDDAADPNPLGFAEQRLDREMLAQRLAAARADNPPIDAYLAALDRQQAAGIARRATRVDITRLPYAEFHRRLEERPQAIGQVWAHYWGERASAEARDEAARDLLAEQEPEHLNVYLRIFSHVPFPGPLDRLFELSQHDNDKVATSALVALGQHTAPAVRDLALTILDDPAASSHMQTRAIWLLERNYADGDYARIERVMQNVPRYDAREYHDLGAAVLDVCAANPSPAAAPVLCLVYEHGPCSWCREEAVELLHALGQLPAWMVAECRLDANLGLREKVRAYAVEGATASAVGGGCA